MFRPKGVGKEPALFAPTRAVFPRYEERKDMPKYRTGPTIASVAQLPGQIAKSARDGRPPAQIGNIWCGFDHQPTSSELQDREEAAGISVSAPKQEREIAILNDIYKRLMSLRRSAAAR